MSIDDNERQLGSERLRLPSASRKSKLEVCMPFVGTCVTSLTNGIGVIHVEMERFPHGCDRLWPNRLWSSLFDRLWSTFGWPTLAQPTLAEIGVSVFRPSHKEQGFFFVKKIKMKKKDKEETNKKTKTAAGQTTWSVFFW